MLGGPDYHVGWFKSFHEPSLMVLFVTEMVQELVTKKGLQPRNRLLCPAK